MTPPTSVNHYENFPVASVLCPPRLRAPIAAIYGFARTADDLADEGSASSETRLADLAAYRRDLEAIGQKQPASPRWPQVFEPLGPILHAFALPVHLLSQLLDAFEQDIRFTASRQRYTQDDELLAYCKLSANPVGRLLLHLYGKTDELSLTQSDQICTALQLTNFWQDLSRDLPRARWYPSLDTMARFGVTERDLQSTASHPNASKMMAYYAHFARATMLKGSKLAVNMPGRAGWELRLVVQGGLRILDKIEALQFETWRHRPRITAWDAPLMLWRAARMRATV